MRSRRAAMPLVRLEWQTWVVMAVVLALVITTAVLLIIDLER
jgi:hypothetical protein